MKRTFLVLIILITTSFYIYSADSGGPKLPEMAFKGQKIDLTKAEGINEVSVNGEIVDIGSFVIKKTGKINVLITTDKGIFKYTIHSIPGILTIIPPILAILLAMIFKEVITALFIGVFAGALLLNNFNILKSFFNVIDKYIINAIVDHDRASIVIFTLLLGGMVGIITKTGGFKGIVDSLSRRVKSSRSTQMYTWLMGIFIFFDDYTNTLIVGNTMRPLSDKWKISREKLSYIVDSTAAPMVSIALISTWIGFEISLINQSLTAYNIEFDAYSLLLSSIPLRYYSILSLIFVFLIFTMNKDFGPMLKAERRAKKGILLNEKAVPLSDFESSGLTPSKFVTPSWYSGIIPIITVILVAFIGLYYSGKAALVSGGSPIAERSFFSILFSGSILKDLGSIISAADSFRVLLWASLMGVLSAMTIAIVRKVLKMREAISSMVQGMKSMMMAILILIMAWSLGVVLVELKTADYLVSLLSSNLDYHLFPAIVFIFSAAISFSTGTSWGTISIMYPLVIPITIGLLANSPDLKHFLVLTISSVLAGSVFGDHCSPISDTTIMSSMASSCDHIDHVKTQIPYALTIGGVALFGGIIPFSYGLPYVATAVITLSFLAIILHLLGNKP